MKSVHNKDTFLTTHFLPCIRTVADIIRSLKRVRSEYTLYIVKLTTNNDHLSQSPGVTSNLRPEVLLLGGASGRLGANTLIVIGEINLTRLSGRTVEESYFLLN